MPIGKLRHRAMMQQKITTDDSGGGEDVVWADVGQVWCRIRPISGLQKMESLRRESTISHEITMRYNRDVSSLNRILFKGRTFNIDGVRDIDERGVEMVLTASEGVAT